MANILLKARLALELPPVNAALERAAHGLPEPVRPVALHIFEAGGKRLRPLLVVLTARLLGYERADIYDLAVTMEMLHAATLLHDDVLDNAASRRGKPAAHTIFDVTPTILAGDALLAQANALVAGFGDPRLSLCFSEATSRTAAGEILEIAAQRRVDTSAEEYAEIVRGKTAWLIRASCQLGALRAGGTGLNLTAADIVIHYDPWWNVAAQNQATDRAYRIGQQNPVQVYKLIAQDTIEEKIVELQQAKQSLADTVTGTADGAILSMRLDELLQLLEGSEG